MTGEDEDRDLAARMRRAQGLDEGERDPDRGRLPMEVWFSLAGSVPVAILLILSLVCFVAEAILR